MAGAQAPRLNSEQRARVLGEVLGRMREFRGDIVVIKYGGRAMTDPDAQETFASNVQFLQHAEVFPTVVHGGGPQVSAMFDKLGTETPFREGVRITTPEAIEIVHMVFIGQVQRCLMSHLNQRDSLAVGIPGEDGALFNARRRTGVDEKEGGIDSGPVDEITSVDPSAALELPDVGCTPVTLSIAIDQDNVRQVPNTNADAAAPALAVALGASKFLMSTDVEGAYSNYPGPDPLLHHTTLLQLRAPGDAISLGMTLRVQACLQTIEGGVDAAHAMDGRQMHSILIEAMTDEGTGMMVVPDPVEKDAWRSRLAV